MIIIQQKYGILAKCKHCGHISIWSLYCTSCKKNKIDEHKNSDNISNSGRCISFRY